MTRQSFNLKFLQLTLLVILLSVSPSALSSRPAETFRGFTLVRQVTDYDNVGHSMPAYTETLYVSKTGDWRYVGRYPNGQTIETIYLCNKGVFYTDHRNKQLVRFDTVGAGRPGPTTAERLQADPKFVRTEELLGHRAYLHTRQAHNYIEETYFNPALGPFPFKRVNYHQSYTRIEEPVSLEFGEPDAANLAPPDYPLNEQELFYDKSLAERLEEQPNATYPPEAQALKISGEILIQVIVDESGRVARAVVIRNLPLLAGPALEAASRTRFSPFLRGGKPVKVSGLIKYQFPAQ
ncbi:MAG TPA: energy transducer TonB [Pyrinomonadaceae bacterium]|nr:energy transducer TonB [Pyrinomonadaceae bacterium]